MNAWRFGAPNLSLCYGRTKYAYLNFRCNTSMSEKDNYFRYFIIIAILIVVVSIAFPFVVNHYFCNWATSGTFGDTYGTLNAIFSGIAISGLIVTLLMQRKELQNQRKEFAIGRTTDIIYKQLERYESAVEQFKIEYDYKSYIGHGAIFFLDISKQTVYYPVDDKRTEAEILKERKVKNCTAMKIYSFNDKSIAQFSLSAYNAASVVKEILLRSDLTINEINELKNLFFRNIGFIHLGVLDDISAKFKEYLELSMNDNDNYIEECDIDFGKLSKAHIFLNSILKFRGTIITAENLKETKENWSQEIGSHA